MTAVYHSGGWVIVANQGLKYSTEGVGYPSNTSHKEEWCKATAIGEQTHVRSTREHDGESIFHQSKIHL